MRRVDGNPRRLLLRRIGSGAFLVGVGLQRQGLGDGEEFRGGQAFVEAARHFCAECCDRVGRDHRVESDRFRAATGDRAGGTGVGTQPQFGLGLPVGFNSEQPRDLGGGSPRVLPNVVGESPHGQSLREAERCALELGSPGRGSRHANPDKTVKTVIRGVFPLNFVLAPARFNSLVGNLG